MAYRLPTDRREAAATTYNTSYLDDFLDQIESLPANTKSLFHEMRELDDRIGSTVTEAENVSKEAILRATTKGVPLENVKRTFHEFVHHQTSAAEFADKKVRIAKEARDNVLEAINDINDKLVDFEAQLRREGRWPGMEKSNDIKREERRLSKGVSNIAERPPSRVPSRAPSRSPPPDPVRVREKSRRREGLPTATTPRAAALAARVKEEAENAEKLEKERAEVEAKPPPKIKSNQNKDKDGDVIMAGAQQGAEENAEVYCTCRKVSYGDMVACDGKNCKIEWFHYECVGITEEPKGAWYCPDCAASMKKKGTSGRRKAS